MKKLFLSLFVAFAASSAMANIQLELKASPLNPGVGAKDKYIRVYTNGTVFLNYCDIQTGVCDPAIYLATLSHYAMNHIYNLTEQARYGTLLENKPLCTAVPVEAKTYTGSNGTVVLESGTYPCGVFTQNTSDAAYYLIGVLRQYE